MKLVTVAHSRLFHIESVNFEFSNGERLVYERMRTSPREAMMIVMGNSDPSFVDP
jgi:ADP-ribose diphosphatase